MSDHTLSSLRRRARQTGSTEDRAAVIVARLRSAPACERCGGTGLVSMTLGAGSQACPSCAGTGSPLRARVELAAHCRDEAARAVIPIAEAHHPSGRWTSWEHMDQHQALGAWVKSLARWSDIHPRALGWVLVRAAVAAARVALEEMRCDDPHSNSPDWQAPRGHRATGCASGAAPRRAIAAAEAWLAGDPTEERWTAFHVAYVEAGHLAWLPPPCSTAHVARILDAISAAAALAGEAPVRRAICDSLVSWALGDA